MINTRTLLPIGHEIAIMLVFMGVMMPLGYFVFKRVEQRVKRLGTIGMH